jgi:hypothetical protein
MKLVYWLFILVLLINLIAGDSRAAILLASHMDALVAMKIIVIGIGAVILTLILMKLLFADFDRHIPTPPPEEPPSESAPSETTG